jgi:ribosome-associated protein
LTKKKTGHDGETPEPKPAAPRRGAGRTGGAANDTRAARPREAASGAPARPRRPGPPGAAKKRPAMHGDSPSRPRIHASHAPAPARGGGARADDARKRRAPRARPAPPPVQKRTPLAPPRRPAGGRKSAPPTQLTEPSAASRELAVVLAAAGIDRKAVGIEILDVSGRVDYADFLVIMTGRSDRHVHAIASGIEEAMAAKRVAPISIEGLTAATWVLLDFGDVVVHVFQEDARMLYDIEGLWIDASRVPVPEPGPGAPTSAKPPLPHGG